MDFLFAGVYVVTAGWKELVGKMRSRKKQRLEKSPNVIRPNESPNEEPKLSKSKKVQTQNFLKSHYSYCSYEKV